jgi:hypothetical protein
MPRASHLRSSALEANALWVAIFSNLAKKNAFTDAIYQYDWLATQGEALNISSEQIMSDVLAEWLTRHRDATRNGNFIGDFLQQALEDFILRHHEEFLPVVAIE